MNGTTWGGTLVTETDLLLAIYALGKGKPMNVVSISDVKKAAGDHFDILWRRLVTGGYVDGRFAVGQTRLTDKGMRCAEDLSS